MYLLICDLQVEDEAQVDQDNEQDETNVRLSDSAKSLCELFVFRT